MNKLITTKNIKETIIIAPSTEFAYIELHTTIKGITIYNGSMWGIQQITLNEDGTLTAQVNGDPLAILLHNIRDIQITKTIENMTKYIVNIEYNIQG